MPILPENALYSVIRVGADAPFLLKGKWNQEIGNLTGKCLTSFPQLP
jgi:hypothetical protein